MELSKETIITFSSIIFSQLHKISFGPFPFQLKVDKIFSSYSFKIYNQSSSSFFVYPLALLRTSSWMLVFVCLLRSGSFFTKTIKAVTDSNDPKST